jgi:NADPH:quinone reductase-like Zn-dependent oxidoreductase
VDLPDPHPGPGQVRIVVHAAGINATEWKLRKGLLGFGAGLPQTTGRDVAGVVDEVGEGVSDVAVGDRVFGVSDDGAGAAEFALLTYRAIISPSLGFVDTAGLPIALETATRALDQLGVTSRSTLLINGATGGIGTTAVQLAVARGARVIGAASAANQSYLSLLGAEPVTYGDGMVERVRALAPGGVDAALDVAGSGVLPQLIDLASGPQNVVTLADFEGAKQGARGAGQ